MAVWSQLSLGASLDVDTGWKTGVVASILVGGCAILLYKWYQRPTNLPPGPPGLPLVGVLPFLSSELHRDCIKFGHRYKSDLVSFYTGNKLMVALNTERLIREAFAKDEFSGRGKDFTDLFIKTDMIRDGVNSEEWRKNKKFMMQSLRNFGFGTPKAEEKISNQLKNLKKAIDAKDISKPWSEEELGLCLNKVTGSIILEILFSVKYDWNDQDFEELPKAVLGLKSVFLRVEPVFSLLFSVFPEW